MATYPVSIYARYSYAHILPSMFLFFKRSCVFAQKSMLSQQKMLHMEIVAHPDYVSHRKDIFVATKIIMRHQKRDQCRLNMFSVAQKRNMC